MCLTLTINNRCPNNEEGQFFIDGNIIELNGNIRTMVYGIGNYNNLSII